MKKTISLLLLVSAASVQANWFKDAAKIVGSGTAFLYVMVQDQKVKNLLKKPTAAQTIEQARKNLEAIPAPIETNDSLTVTSVPAPVEVQPSKMARVYSLCTTAKETTLAQVSKLEKPSVALFKQNTQSAWNGLKGFASWYKN